MAMETPCRVRKSRTPWMSKLAVHCGELLLDDQCHVRTSHGALTQRWDRLTYFTKQALKRRGVHLIASEAIPQLRAQY